MKIVKCKEIERISNVQAVLNHVRDSLHFYTFNVFSTLPIIIFATFLPLDVAKKIFSQIFAYSRQLWNVS